MRVLFVSRYKSFYADHQLPFVTEQGEAIRALGNEVEFYLLRGNYVKQYFALRKKINEWKPDMVHAHYGLTAVVAELQNKVPVVTTFHNGETHEWWVNFISSLMSLRAKHVIYVAQHVRDLLYFKPKQYSIIPCGVPKDKMVITPKKVARAQLGWRDDTKYIVFGGAFDDERKNYALLQEAVEKMVGNTVWEPIEGGEKVGNIACVELKGLLRSDCVLRMCGADLFALPSHSEGSPQALKEAMAVNCPCIATDIADVRMLFGDKSGHWILRNPKSTPERWDPDEKSLDEFIDLLKEALTYGQRTHGRDQIEKLGLFNEQIAKRIVKIYEGIMKV